MAAPAPTVLWSKQPGSGGLRQVTEALGLLHDKAGLQLKPLGSSTHSPVLSPHLRFDFKRNVGNQLIRARSSVYLNLYLFMCVNVFLACVCVYHVHAVSVEARRGHHIPWDWSSRWL